MKLKALSIIVLLFITCAPVHAQESNETDITAGIFAGINNIISSAISGIPSSIWNYFFTVLLLAPLGLDDTSNKEDIISTTGFFLTSYPDIEPFRPMIHKLAELLLIFLALGIVAVAIKASFSDSDIRTVVKEDILPLFISAFLLGIVVDIYKIALYIADTITQLFTASINMTVFRNLTLFLISPDLLGLLAVCIITLLAVFLLLTYILILVHAFLFPIFITLRALPFSITKAIGESGITFTFINISMPVISSILIFISVSIWGSATFWNAMALDAFSLELTKRILGMIFLLLAVLIPVSFYLGAFILPILKFAIGIKIIRR